MLHQISYNNILQLSLEISKDPTYAPTYSKHQYMILKLWEKKYIKKPADAVGYHLAITQPQYPDKSEEPCSTPNTASFYTLIITVKFHNIWGKIHKSI